MATTGGKYHHLADKVWQPSYLLFEIPLRFTLGRHEITLLPSYRKYYNQWTTRYAVAAEEYGRFEQKLFDDVQTPVYYLIGGGGQQYIVDYQNTTDMGSSFLSNTPYVASATVKYTYNGKRVLVSASWQSYQVVGTSALGNGPMHNDIGVLSETTANPNTLLVTQNPEGKYPAVGRLDQDRAYIGRVLLGWNITDNWQFGFTFKFKDGQAFTNYDVCISDDGKQAVLINHRSRGINPTDGNFGSRDDAFFNLDMHIGYRGWIRKAVWLQAQLQAYNLYDFATELTEFCFEQEIVGSGRNAMSLCIPRGLILNMKVGF